MTLKFVKDSDEAYIYIIRNLSCRLISVYSASDLSIHSILPTKTTATQNVALSYHRVRGQLFSRRLFRIVR